MRKNYVSGITLIALVVTIIVLLILAGISIQMLTGDNGILSRAESLNEKTTQGKEKDAISIVWNVKIADKYLNKTEITDIMLENELNNNGDNVVVGYDDNNDYLVYFKDTKNTYLVKKDGTITQLEHATSLITETIYVILYNDGTLAFSNNSDTDTTKTIIKSYTIGMDDIYETQDMVPWNNETSSIMKVIFVNQIRPTSTRFWFGNCINMTAIENIVNLNTSQVKDMAYMFNGCEKMLSLDLSTFDTRRVTNMMFMFGKSNGAGGSDMALKEIIFGGKFDTKNCTDMQQMFKRCSSLTNIDLSNFDTSKVTNMQGMFASCEKITNINLSNFDTSNVTNMNSMFYSCSNLTRIDLSNFNTSKVVNMMLMFGKYDSDGGSDMMLQEVIFGNTFDTKNVTRMDQMFKRCSNLKTIYVMKDFVTTAITNSESMFYKCISLKGGNGTTFISSKIDKEYARIDGGPSSSTPGYFTYKNSN